mgnify:CR=1 FL=1
MTTTTLPLTKQQVLQHTVQQERSRLLNFIRKRVPDDADAEDLVQDVFLQLANNYDLVNPIRQVTSWLFTVARNKIIDFYRKKRPINMSQLAAPQTAADEEAPYLEEIYFEDTNDPGQELLKQSVWEALSEALEELPEDQRQVFIWHELEGRSFKAIAEATGVSVNTLLSRKRYAVIRLRERLQQVYDELLND